MKTVPITALAALYLLLSACGSAPPQAGAADSETMAGSGECLKPGEAITGRLTRAEAPHPNGTRMNSFFVILPAARCVESSRGAIVSGTKVQLIPIDGEDFASSSENAEITIAAEEYFEPETAWHFGDIVALRARAVERHGGNAR